jgi:hypothetical protein
MCFVLAWNSRGDARSEPLEPENAPKPYGPTGHRGPPRPDRPTHTATPGQHRTPRPAATSTSARCRSGTGTAGSAPSRAHRPPHTMAAVGSFLLIFGRTRSEEGKVVPPPPSLGLHGHPTTPSCDSEVEVRGRGAVTAGVVGSPPMSP